MSLSTCEGIFIVAFLTDVIIADIVARVVTFRYNHLLLANIAEKYFQSWVVWTSILLIYLVLKWMDLTASFADCKAIWNIFAFVANEADNIVTSLVTSSITLRNITDYTVANITICY